MSWWSQQPGTVNRQLHQPDCVDLDVVDVVSASEVVVKWITGDIVVAAVDIVDGVVNCAVAWFEVEHVEAAFEPMDHFRH